MPERVPSRLLDFLDVASEDEDSNSDANDNCKNIMEII